MKYNSLEQFLQMQIQSTQNRPGPAPRISECRRIEKVAPHSIAARVGLSRGDYLVSLNGKNALSLPPHLYYDTSNQKKYTFYSISRQEEIELVTNGIEPGILIQPTVESIKKYFDPSKSTPEDLMVLWEGQDWQALKELARRVLEYQRVKDIPEFLFYGASLYETGEKGKGFDIIGEYLDQYSQNWTRDFTGLGLYYLGRVKQEEGDSQKALEILGEAYQMAEKEALAREYQKIAGRRPLLHKSPWLHQVFPSDYRLETLEVGKRTVGLLQTLNKMKPEQMLVVCLLDGYRGNGPYNDFMLRYYNYIRHFRDFLYGLHVVTREPQRPGDRPHYFEAEDMVRKGALPLEILYDATGEIAQKLSPPGSPHIFLLDSKQKVLFEGHLDGIEFWNVVVSRMPDAPALPNQDKALAKLIMDLNILGFDQIRSCAEKSRLDASKSFEQILLEDGLLSPDQLEDLKSQLASPAPASITPPSATVPLQHTVLEQGTAGEEARQKETFLKDSPVAHSMVEQAATRISGSQIAVSVDASQESYGNIRPGTRLNEDLEILHLLGQGGMGAVFLAEQKSLHRKVAIKVLAAGIAGDEDFRARFDREAKTAAGLSHPNIIQVYGTGQYESQPYIVMEFVEGESLKDMIVREGALPAKKALSITLQAAKALESAHKQGILHRDIKPDNIFIDKQGIVKLGDFGIAKNMNQSSLTQTGTVMGTPHYMSPEQAEGKEVDSRTDIYSLGATLYHGLVGRPPFDGDSPMTVMYKQINHPVSFPREMRSSLPDPLKKTVEYMMIKDKWRRPKIMGDVVEKLEESMRALEGIPVEARPASTGASPSPLHPGEPGVPAAQGAPSAQGEDFSLSYIYSMVGGVLVVFLVILFFATSGKNTSPDLTSTTPPPLDTPKKPVIPVKLTPEKTVRRVIRGGVPKNR